MPHKSRMFSFRISERDYLTIQTKAAKAGQNMTAFITNSALGKNIVVVDGLDRTIAELKGIGRNLNQLTALCNMGKIKCLDLNELKRLFGAAFDAINAMGGGR